MNWIINNPNEGIAIGEYTDIIWFMNNINEQHKLSEEKQLEGQIENIRKLHDAGITYVISCRENHDELEEKIFREAWHKGILVRYIWEPIPARRDMYEDGLKGLPDSDLWRLGIDNVMYKISSIFFQQDRDKILVHCTAGIDRAPFVVAKVLVKHFKSVWDDKGLTIFRTFRDAYGYIKKKRPFIQEHYEWRNRFEEEDDRKALLVSS